MKTALRIDRRYLRRALYFENEVHHLITPISIIRRLARRRRLLLFIVRFLQYGKILLLKLVNFKLNDKFTPHKSAFIPYRWFSRRRARFKVYKEERRRFLRTRRLGQLNVISVPKLFFKKNYQYRLQSSSMSNLKVISSIASINKLFSSALSIIKSSNVKPVFVALVNQLLKDYSAFSGVRFAVAGLNTLRNIFIGENLVFASNRLFTTELTGPKIAFKANNKILGFIGGKSSFFTDWGLLSKPISSTDEGWDAFMRTLKHLFLQVMFWKDRRRVFRALFHTREIRVPKELRFVNNKFKSLMLFSEIYRTMFLAVRDFSGLLESKRVLSNYRIANFNNYFSTRKFNPRKINHRKRVAQVIKAVVEVLDNKEGHKFLAAHNDLEYFQNHIANHGLAGRYSGSTKKQNNHRWGGKSFKVQHRSLSSSRTFSTVALRGLAQQSIHSYALKDMILSYIKDSKLEQYNSFGKALMDCSTRRGACTRVVHYKKQKTGKGVISLPDLKQKLKLVFNSRKYKTFTNSFSVFDFMRSLSKGDIRDKRLMPMYLYLLELELDARRHPEESQTPENLWAKSQLFNRTTRLSLNAFRKRVLSRNGVRYAYKHSNVKCKRTSKIIREEIGRRVNLHFREMRRRGQSTSGMLQSDMRKAHMRQFSLVRWAGSRFLEGEQPVIQQAIQRAYANRKVEGRLLKTTYEPLLKARQAIFRRQIKASNRKFIYFSSRRLIKRFWGKFIVIGYYRRKNRRRAAAFRQALVEGDSNHLRSYQIRVKKMHKTLVRIRIASCGRILWKLQYRVPNLEKCESDDSVFSGTTHFIRKGWKLERAIGVSKLRKVYFIRAKKLYKGRSQFQYRKTVHSKRGRVEYKNGRSWWRNAVRGFTNNMRRIIAFAGSKYSRVVYVAANKKRDFLRWISDISLNNKIASSSYKGVVQKIGERLRAFKYNVLRGKVTAGKKFSKAISRLSEWANEKISKGKKLYKEWGESLTFRKLWKHRRKLIKKPIIVKQEVITIEKILHARMAQRSDEQRPEVIISYRRLRNSARVKRRARLISGRLSTRLLKRSFYNKMFKFRLLKYLKPYFRMKQKLLLWFSMCRLSTSALSRVRRYYKEWTLKYWRLRNKYRRTFLWVYYFSMLFKLPEVILEYIRRRFRKLHKARHYRYFRILKHLMKNRSNMDSLAVMGYRFLVRGKLRARTRRRRLDFQYGRVAIYDWRTKLHFHKMHSITRYGVFGMSFWLCY